MPHELTILGFGPTTAQVCRQGNVYHYV